MHVHVLCPDESPALATSLTRAMQSLNHVVTGHPLRGQTVPEAANLGHELADCWAAEGQPDVVLAADWLSGVAAQIATRERRIPVVQRLYAPGSSRNQDRRRLEIAIARGAAAVLAACSADADRLVDHGVRRRAIRVVPHGVDTQAFIDDGPTLPASAGRRIVARPDGDDASTRRLLSMLSFLPTCELVLLTTTSTSSATLRAVGEPAGSEPTGDRVRLLDVTESEATAATVAVLLRSSDLVVVTGDDRTDLDLALQAMACGRPVVGHGAGGLADAVVDNGTGVLVTSSSAEALATAVRGLLVDDLSREAFGLAAFDRARASFDWATVGPAIGRVLEEVVPEVKSGPVHADASP